MNRKAIALLALGHCLIDLCQGVVPALLPFLAAERGFSYAAAASLVFAISATSSVIQPLFGQFADRASAPWLLPASVLLAGGGLALGAQSGRFAVVLCAFGVSGLGVAAFHPEAARSANLASGDRRTTGMSLFSLGGGVGFAIAPSLTMFLEKTWGTGGLLSLLAPTALIAAMITGVSAAKRASPGASAHPRHDPPDDWRGFAILSGATISRSIVFYGFNTFLAFYFVNRFHQTPAEGTRALAVFLGTSIVGTLIGGWLADRYNRRGVIRVGFLGAVLFLGLFARATDPVVARALLIPLALFIFLPTSVLVVLGQEYLPSRLGVASGVTLGLAVSVGGMTAPLLGMLADRHGIGVVMVVLWFVLIVAGLQALALPAVKSREA